MIIHFFQTLDIYSRQQRVFATLQVVAVASLPKEIAAGLHPKQNKAIRALMLQSGWVVERLEDDSCMVTYVIQVSISKIINSSTKKQKHKLRSFNLSTHPCFVLGKIPVRSWGVAAKVLCESTQHQTGYDH